jgi:hypothetical protein
MQAPLHHAIVVIARLDRAIQYSRPGFGCKADETCLVNPKVWWLLDRPVKPGDDKCQVEATWRAGGAPLGTVLAISPVRMSALSHFGTAP